MHKVSERTGRAQDPHKVCANQNWRACVLRAGPTFSGISSAAWYAIDIGMSFDSFWGYLGPTFADLEGLGGRSEIR